MFGSPHSLHHGVDCVDLRLKPIDLPALVERLDRHRQRYQDECESDCVENGNVETFVQSVVDQKPEKLRLNRTVDHINSL
jgi:response regulator of citrate/malate metabolism